jgi:hypothetical protein
LMMMMMLSPCRISVHLRVRKSPLRALEIDLDPCLYGNLPRGHRSACCLLPDDDLPG